MIITRHQSIDMNEAYCQLANVVLGGVGIALATPLVAAAVVIVRMLYVEDVLGDQVPTVTN